MDGWEFCLPIPSLLTPATQAKFASYFILGTAIIFFDEGRGGGQRKTSVKQKAQKKKSCKGIHWKKSNKFFLLPRSQFWCICKKSYYPPKKHAQPNGYFIPILPIPTLAFDGHHFVFRWWHMLRDLVCSSCPNDHGGALRKVRMLHPWGNVKIIVYSDIAVYSWALR